MTLLQRIVRFFPLLLLIFIDDMGNALFYPLLPSIMFDPNIGVLPADASLTVRQLWYGLVLAAFPFMMFLSAPILGDLSDIYGRKKVLVISLIGTIVGYLVTAVGVSNHCLGVIIAGRALDGLTAGNFPIAQAAIIDLSEPHEKTENISLLVFSISLGFIIGPVMSAVLSSPSLVSWFSLATPLYAASCLGMVNLIAILYFFHDAYVPVKKVFKLKLNQAMTLFSDAFAYPEIRYLSVLNLFLLLGWGTYIQYVSAFLHQVYHFDRVGLAAFNVVMALSFALSSLVIIKIMLRYFSGAVITCFALAISCFGVAITVTTYQPIFAWLGIVPVSIGISLSHATIITMYSDQVDASRQGWIMGVTSSVLALSIGVSAILGGVMGHMSIRITLAMALVFYAIATALSYNACYSTKLSKP
jgi:MFS family permease